MALLACATLAGCASAPVAVDADEVLVETVLASPADPFGDPIARADCTLRNGVGEWHVATPASVRIARSTRPLEYDCTRDGFAPAHGIAGCTRAAEIERVSQAMAALQFLALVPYAVVAAPVAPALAAGAAGQAVVAGGAVAESGARATPGDDCVYRSVRIELVPLPR